MEAVEFEERAVPQADRRSAEGLSQGSLADDPGVLILSQFAGAAEDMTEAIIVNPLDADQMAKALHEALVMPLDERQARHKALFAKVCASSAKAYCDRFLGALSAAKVGAAANDEVGARAASSG